MGWVIILLVIVVVLFGVQSSMQSYAVAQQAQAQIETAQAAQVASWGNLITILAIVLFVFLIVIFLAGVLWVSYKRNQQRAMVSQPRPQMVAQDGQPQLSVNDLMMLIALKTLQDMNAPTQNYLPAPGEEQPTDEPFSWLK